MAYEGEERRVNGVDVYGFDIQSLIAQENDPDKRVTLIVLNNMNNTLLETVSAVRGMNAEIKEQRESFEAHETRENAMINQGRGMWRVIAGLAFAVQGLVGWAWYEVRDTLKTMQATDAQVLAWQAAADREKRK